MPKPFSPQIISANHLLTGDTIYLTRTGWSPLLNDAAVASTKDDSDALLQRAVNEPAIAVGPYTVDVEQTSDGLMPTKYREKFRVSGPTVGALNEGAVVAQHASERAA